MPEGNGNGNGNGQTTWDKGFWRFARYATVIGGTAWAAFGVNAKLDRVEKALSSVQGDVSSIARNTLTRAEAERVLDEANEVWQVEEARHGVKFRPLRLTPDHNEGGKVR